MTPEISVSPDGAADPGSGSGTIRKHSGRSGDGPRLLACGEPRVEGEISDYSEC